MPGATNVRVAQMQQNAALRHRCAMVRFDAGGMIIFSLVAMKAPERARRAKSFPRLDGDASRQFTRKSPSFQAVVCVGRDAGGQGGACSGADESDPLNSLRAWCPGDLLPVAYPSQSNHAHLDRDGTGRLTTCPPWLIQGALKMTFPCRSNKTSDDSPVFSSVPVFVVTSDTVPSLARSLLCLS